jgi:capsular polysaccharide transport system permease protein
MINRLSAIARDDATAYAREELDQAVERLKRARQAMTRFRNETQIVDPSASIQGQMGILSSLQSELAQTFIDLDILRQTARENDPRITQLERRVRVIEDRIEAERRKLGMGQGDGRIQDADAFANLVGEFESLAVDLKFAEESYTASLSAYDSAVAEAQRKSRYLAAHVNPTLPEAATRPDRLTLLGLVALFTFLTWAILVLAIYALQDRR